MQSATSSGSASNATSPAASGSAATPPKEKPADYVYFERTTAGFSDDAVPRAKAAQLKLEHYYKIAVEAAVERNARYVVSLHSLLFTCICLLGFGDHLTTHLTMRFVDVSNLRESWLRTQRCQTRENNDNWLSLGSVNLPS